MRASSGTGWLWFAKYKNTSMHTLFGRFGKVAWAVYIDGAARGEKHGDTASEKRAMSKLFFCRVYRMFAQEVCGMRKRGC